MVSRCRSVALVGLEPQEVEVQCAFAAGVPSFRIVGLPDKAVAESRDRVRAALASIGVGLPSKQVVINLAPASLPKEGAHYDLAVALVVLAEMEIVPREDVEGCIAIGELALDGTLAAVPGALPAAVAAAVSGRLLVCPEGNGPEAALVNDAEVVAPASLSSTLAHFSGRAPLPRPAPAEAEPDRAIRDLSDVKGQLRSRRAVEIAAAGGHNLLMIGPPGVGKSMLARRIAGLLPPLDPQEALELSLVRSVAGVTGAACLARSRPFEEAHHATSTAALVGGGRTARPGRITLAHHGVLFLDELAEFARGVLDALRQPLESGVIPVSRAEAHVLYPCRIQLVAAMNPCRCGHFGDPARACGRAPRCARDYQARVSGPLLDRIDLQVETEAAPPAELADAPAGEPTAPVAARVRAARERQKARFEALDLDLRLNAEAEGGALDAIAELDEPARRILAKAAEAFSLSARGVSRVIRLARTVADLAGDDVVRREHVAEAAGFRRAAPRG